MLHIVRKSVTVQKIGLLTLGKSAQTFVQLTHGFFVHINLFRRLDGRISNGFNAQQPFLTGKDLIQPDFLQGKSVCGAGHFLLILRENIPYQVGHGVADERCGIGQKLNTLAAVKERDGGQQTEAAFLFQIAGFCTEIAFCQIGFQINLIGGFADETQIVFQKKVTSLCVPFLRQRTEPLIIRFLHRPSPVMVLALRWSGKSQSTPVQAYSTHPD